MDIIGQGAQYKVIDTDDGRVRKVLLTRAESQAVVAGWYAEGEAAPAELAVDYRRLATTSARRVRELLAEYPQLSYSFGDPVFESRYQYTQTKVRVLGNVLRESTTQEGERLIEAYVEVTLLHWRYGIFEQTFNCTSSHGVDSQGRVVLLDFGEVSIDKTQAALQVGSKVWLGSYTYTRSLPERLKDYYARTLEARLSSQTLIALWGSALK
jgi:hypothetical protein